MGKKHLLFTFCLSLILGACSDGPEQYQRGDLNLPTGDASLNPEIGTTFVPENYPADQDLIIGRVRIPYEMIEDDLEDDIVKKNSSNPIIYKESFSGVTFDTEFSEGKNILAEPRGITSNGIYVYREGVGILWRTQDPHVPAAVIVLPSYLGGFQLDQTLGEIKIGSPVVDHFLDDDGTGKTVIKKYFNALEKKDASYDCLATSECELNLVDQGRNYEFVFPSATLQISVDRKVVNYIILLQDLKPGNLDNSFDIVNQNIPFLLKDNSGAEIEASINFGADWATTKELINGQGITSVSTDGFSVQHNGVIAVLTKENYERSYEKPDDSEKLNGLVFIGGYNKKFKFDGKYLNYNYNLSSKIFNFSKSDEIPSNLFYEITDGTPAANVSDMSNLKLLNVEFEDGKSEFKYGDVKLPINYADGSLFYQEDATITATQEEIDFFIENNPGAEITPELAKETIILAKKTNAFNNATSNLFESNPSSQTFGLATTLLTPVQKNKMKDPNVSVDEDQMKVDFMVGLTNFIENEIKTKNPDKIVFTKIDGLFSQAERGEYAARILMLDDSTGEGNILILDMNKLNANLNRVLSIDLDSEFNRKSFPALSKPLEIKTNEKLKSFQGFTLGESIKIKDIDLGREEATVLSMDESMSERVEYLNDSLRSMIYDNSGQILKETLARVIVGNLGVSLYVVPVVGEQDVYKIVQIMNSFIPQTINNVCGLSGLDFKISMPANEFIAKLNQKISEKRQTDAGFDCTKFEEKRNDGSGKVASITFPNQGIKFYFSSNQLTNFGIYTTVNDALNSEGQ